ncbi:MAG: restriction endonuclease subunit S [Candidatus Thiodiazotropha sp. (ex Ctena orbiculata)]|nr:restriction endonuclease subunit S [Candidatus Thiodiazotropha taylori]
MTWPTAPLGEVAPAKPLRNTDVTDDASVWQVTLDHIESDTGLLLQKNVRPYGDAGSSTHWFDDRHVLYSKLRPYLNKVLLPDELGLGTTELVPLCPVYDTLDRKYLAYYLRSKKFVNWVSGQIAGAKMPRVSMKVFWGHEIPLPPLKEQKRIVAILDKADAIRRKRQQAIQLADEFLRSVFLDMFGDPGTNPNNWPMGTIRELAADVRYGSSSKAGAKGKFPILRMNNITYTGSWNFGDLKFIDLSEKDQSKYLVHQGEILFNRTNSKELVGKTAVYREATPMAFAGYLIRVRTNELANSEYISAYLNSRHGKLTLESMCKNIVGMANINAQEMQDIVIAIPPRKLQDRYAGIVHRTLEHRSKQVQADNSANKLFGSLSQGAFRGDI